MPSDVPHPEAILRGHAGEVQALDFDPQERFLVSGDSLGEVRVWDLGDLRPAAIRRLHPLTAGILSLRLFRSGGRQLLGTQGRDGATLLWAANDQLELSEELVRSFVRDCYSFCRFAVLAAPGPGEAAAAAGSQPEPAASLEQQREQQAAEDFAAAVLADTEPAGDAPAAETAGSGDAAGTAREGGEPEHLAADAAADASGSQPCPIAAAIWALHPCERASPEAPPALLAIPGGSERAAEVVCCACGATLAEFREEAAGRKLGMLMAVQLYCAPAAAAAGAGAGAAAAAAAGDSAAAAADGAHASLRVCLAAGYEDGSLVLWDAAAPAAPRAARRLCTEPVMALALDASVAPAGGAAGSAEDSVVVFKLDHGTPPKISIRHAIELKRQGIADLAVRPDGKLLVTAGWDGRVRAYKYRSGRPLAILKYHASPATAVRFAPRSMVLATAARDGTLALWPLFQLER